MSVDCRGQGGRAAWPGGITDWPPIGPVRSLSDEVEMMSNYAVISAIGNMEI